MVNSTLTERSIESALERSPGWLADIRRDAWERSLARAYPAASEEFWRFTDLGLLNLDEFGLPDHGSAPALDALPSQAGGALELSGTGSGGKLVHSDSRPFSTELSKEAADKGIIFTDLETAVVEHADLLQGRLGALVGTGDMFEARNLALHSG